MGRSCRACSVLTSLDLAFSVLAVMIVWARNPEALRCCLCFLASMIFVHFAFVTWLAADIALAGNTLKDVHNGTKSAFLETLIPYIAATIWRAYGLVILNAYQRWLMALITEKTTLIAAQP